MASCVDEGKERHERDGDREGGVLIHPPTRTQHHAMDFLKMVEHQATEWEARKLQLIASKPITNPITGEVIPTAAQGGAALVGAISAVSKATSNQGRWVGGWFDCVVVYVPYLMHWRNRRRRTTHQPPTHPPTTKSRRGSPQRGWIWPFDGWFARWGQRQQGDYHHPFLRLRLHHRDFSRHPLCRQCGGAECGG